MSNYQNGKIYTIRCHTNDKWIYVGSTIQQYLSSRLAQHKCDKKVSLCKFINNPENNTSWEDWYIELYELYPCGSKEELCKRENEVIREIATINKNGAYLDKKEYQIEYRAENRDKLLAKQKEYNAKNKDTISARMKEYYAENKDKIKEYKKEHYAENRDKIKEHYVENRDKLLAQMKEYKKKHYVENRDKLLAKNKAYYQRKKAEKEGLEN
jgi:hypothetical protein